MPKRYTPSHLLPFKNRDDVIALIKNELDEHRKQAKLVKDNDMKDDIAKSIDIFYNNLQHIPDSELLWEARLAQANLHDLIQIGIYGLCDAKLSDWGALQSEQQAREMLEEARASDAKAKGVGGDSEF